MYTYDKGVGKNVVKYVPEELEDVAAPIEVLQPHSKNPRNGAIAEIKKSIQVNGLYRPIVVNRRTREILAGNHTYFAAMELGCEYIPVTFVDVDDEHAKRILLVDNRMNDLAWTDDALVLDILQDLGSLDGTGYTDEDVEEMMKKTEEVFSGDEFNENIGEGHTCPNCGYQW